MRDPRTPGLHWREILHDPAKSTSSRHCIGALLCAVLVGCVSAPEGKQMRPALKPWRLVIADDADFRAPADDPDLEKFLAFRFKWVVDTHVDAYFLCIASTDALRPKERSRPVHAMSLWAAHGDVLPHVDRMIRKYVEAAHAAGIQIFFAVRLNDIHDAWHPKPTYPLKVARPDLLLGKKGAPNHELWNAHWSGFDWSHAEVRQHFRDFIQWAAARWDFDGVELDWFRHPLFFKLGEEQANIENINEFVRAVRSDLNRIGATRGRPYLLTTRVPDTPRLALRTGLDVEQWLKEGLLDMLMVGGGYMPYGHRVRQFIDMAHRYGVHAYPCKNHYEDPRTMRSAAANFFALGADGVYLFNFGWIEGHPLYRDDPELRPSLRQVGTPETLAGLDKRFLADSGSSIHYLGHTNPPSQFPVTLVGGRPIELLVGDDPVQMADARATLIVKVKDLQEQEQVVFRMNGTRLTADRVERADPDTIRVDVPTDAIVRGVNHVDVLPGPESRGAMVSTVTGMELLIDYAP